MDVTRAEPLGVHMSDMLEFLDTGFLTAPKVDVDPLQRQINTPSKRAKGQELPKSDPSTWWVYKQHGGTGNKENKPRTYRRVTSAERKVALSLQKPVPIPTKNKASPRGMSPNDSKAKSTPDTNPKPKSENGSKTRTPDTCRKTTALTKNGRKPLDQTPEQDSNQGDNEGAGDDSGLFGGDNSEVDGEPNQTKKRSLQSPADSEGGQLKQHPTNEREARSASLELRVTPALSIMARCEPSTCAHAISSELTSTLIPIYARNGSSAYRTQRKSLRGIENNSKLTKRHSKLTKRQSGHINR